MAAFPSPKNLMSAQMQNFGFQGTEVKGESVESRLNVTLLIEHLPEAIPFDTLSRLFSHYGAVSVRPCNSGRLKNCPFFDFVSESLSYQAHSQLNGVRFLGKVLSVERASKLNEESKFKQSEAQEGKDSVLPTALMKDSSVTRDVGDGSKFRSFPVSEPIAPSLGVDYLFPPQLDYAYPPPDGNILTNFVNALIAFPHFYTQEFDDKASYEASGAVKHRRKPIKQESVVGPAVDKDVVREAVGLKPASLVPKEIPVIKKKNPVQQIKIAPKVTQNEHKDDNITIESEDPDKGGSLFGSIDAAKTGHGVKLMQNLVNGYEFKEKPMIIQFWSKSFSFQAKLDRFVMIRKGLFALYLSWYLHPVAVGRLKMSIFRLMAKMCVPSR